LKLWPSVRQSKHFEDFVNRISRQAALARQRWGPPERLNRQRPLRFAGAQMAPGQDCVLLGSQRKPPWDFAPVIVILGSEPLVCGRLLYPHDKKMNRHRCSHRKQECGDTPRGIDRVDTREDYHYSEVNRISNVAIWASHYQAPWGVVSGPYPASQCDCCPCVKGKTSDDKRQPHAPREAAPYGSEAGTFGPHKHRPP